MATRTATFAAGCFWGVEEAFRTTPGVVGTEVGYTGGNAPNPSYQQVCTGMTGHAEAVRLKFDPSLISYPKLLSVFFSMHDPTTLNRQGPDFGTQYRSAIFFHSKEQQRQALSLIRKLEKARKYPSKIVTEVVPAGEFYCAEEYHQKYFQKRGKKGCCMHL